MKLEFSRKISQKSSNIQFHENPSSGRRVVADVQTGRHNEASRFSRFCEKRVKNTATENRHVLVVKSKITHIKMSIPNYIVGQHGNTASRVLTKPKETQLTFSSCVLRRTFSYSLTLNLLAPTTVGARINP